MKHQFLLSIKFCFSYTDLPWTKFSSHLMHFLRSAAGVLSVVRSRACATTESGVDPHCPSPYKSWLKEKIPFPCLERWLLGSKHSGCLLSQREKGNWGVKSLFVNLWLKRQCPTVDVLTTDTIRKIFKHTPIPPKVLRILRIKILLFLLSS